MSGSKAYTYREMKGIVDYLVEHKAYGEIKARKMWMDFSNSSLTTRTWQSLKETFLKRILPDIQNPYYRLTRDQVCSFRQGYDVAEREKKNRLEIQRSEEDSNEVEKRNNSAQPLVTETATSAEKPKEVDKTAGEDIQSEKISARNRSSAETLILEDNRQSKDNSTEDLEVDPKGPPKSMRDCLGFEESEPPPVVQAVLDDFGTDSEDSEESPMAIVESTTKDANEGNANDQEVIVVEEGESVELIENDMILADGGKEVQVAPAFDPEIITDVSTNDLVNWLTECAEEEVGIQADNNDETNTEQEPSNTTNVSSEGVTSINENSESIIIENTEESAENPKCKNKKCIENDSDKQNTLSSTNDTIIPNNQELLDNEVNKTNGISKDTSPEKVATRKRSTSSDQTENKKKKLNNCSGSEKTNGDVETTPPSVKNTETLIQVHKNAETAADNNQKIQDAPVTEVSHENPCLKSVSLFEEQFNTTQYIDSEDEETPIAKNDVKQPEESIVNNNKSSKPNQQVESEKNNESNKPTQEVVIVESSTPVQNLEATPSQGNQGKIDLISKEEDNACKAKIQKHDNKEVTILETANETAQNNRKTRKNKNVLVVSSNSDSDEDVRVTENSKERYKRLSQAFGFVPGTSRTAQRRRSFQNRRARLRTISRGHHESSDGDASYTDIDDAEMFVPPPQGRRNRRGRMYKKPESGKIVSLEEEGRLFVIIGNKVYPLVSDEKDLNYVHYDASDYEEESIWRQKYIDQKKKAAELKKQIEQVKLEASSSRPKSPVLSSTSLRNGGGGTPNAVAADNKDAAMSIIQNDSGKIQITLSNNNEEKINLEGHWPQVLPIMQQVMNMFYKPDNPAAVKENTKVDGTAPIVKEKEDISGRTTPIIPVNSASRKVEELEREIFQEIAERGNVVETGKPDTTSNVTKRKARAPSTSSDKSLKPAKIARKSKKSVDANPEPNPTDGETKVSESKTTDKSPVPLTISDTSSKERSPSKDNLTKKSSTKKTKKIEAGDKNETTDDKKIEDKASKVHKTLNLPPIVPRVTRSRTSGNDTDTSTQNRTKSIAKPKANADDDEVRYMLPPGPKSRKSAAKLTPTKAESPENTHEISQDRFGNSVDSTQGYQDSDVSPLKNITKRKKKLSLVVKKGKHLRRKSFQSVSFDELDSSNSSYFVPRKSISQTTLDSDIYKTESYRILMGGRKHSITKLDAIEECSKTDHVGQRNSMFKTSNDSLVIEIGTGSSSIVSLPFSPELSVVENLSVSKEMLQDISHPTINEHQANNSVVSNLYNQYLMADVDASVPLMQQDCELLDTPHQKTAKRVKKPKAPAKSPIKVSDILNKVSSVNIDANSSLSETLDQRLRDLLLESAKKMTSTSKENLMEVDEPTETKKGKKRSSTPRKRNTRKQKATAGPVLDEHMESCTKAGRQSCPPLSTFVPLDENANNSADVLMKTKKPAKVKKDIIRVKIQRPTKAKEVTDCNTSQVSVYTDSGINESVSINGMFYGNDNVDLIHNHSETCLQAHECIGNSIELVENSKSSVLTIHSTESLQNELDEAMKDIEDFFESPSVECESEEKHSEDVFVTPVTTAYHSPINHPNSSLITEDLSDEIPSPPRKWYLLSEEETNTGFAHKPEEMTSNMRSSNYLKKIFPIACAVPDLSTISEMSKENEDSRKTFGEDTGSNMS